MISLDSAIKDMFDDTCQSARDQIIEYCRIFTIGAADTFPVWWLASDQILRPLVATMQRGIQDSVREQIHDFAG